MKCADFLGLLFLARDVAHSVHLNTRSFSKHTALNIFYDQFGTYRITVYLPQSDDGNEPDDQGPTAAERNPSMLRV